MASHAANDRRIRAERVGDFRKALRPVRERFEDGAAGIGMAPEYVREDLPEVAEEESFRELAGGSIRKLFRQFDAVNGGAAGGIEVGKGGSRRGADPATRADG